jgi:hypothetical protein
MRSFQQWLKEAMAVGPVKGGADFQVRGTGSPGMKKMTGGFGFNIKKMSGFGNPGGISVPKGEK